MTRADGLHFLSPTLAVALAVTAAACTDASGDTKGGEPRFDAALPTPIPSDGGHDADGSTDGGSDAADADDGDAADASSSRGPRETEQRRVFPFLPEDSSFAFVPGDLQKKWVMTGTKNV